MIFKDTLRDVQNACGWVFCHRPTNADILQAATQIYIAQMREDTIRELNLKEWEEDEN